MPVHPPSLAPPNAPRHATWGRVGSTRLRAGRVALLDVQAALNDLARQLRSARAQDGLTLQQLATRCGVAASTIHKIESQQMVPTVSILLKIARGLGRRPSELIRDGTGLDDVAADRTHPTTAAAPSTAIGYDPGIGAWRFDFSTDDRLPPLLLDPGQRLTLLLERGRGELASPSRRFPLVAGACVEIEGESLSFSSDPADPARALLIVSPAGRLGGLLGVPNALGNPPPEPRR